VVPIFRRIIRIVGTFAAYTTTSTVVVTLRMLAAVFSDDALDHSFATIP
jgi:hypothetical protein